MLTAIGDYVILKKLGAGAFGDVFLVEAKDGVKYAIKSLKKRMVYQKRI
jgi:serine/threonine protein kinase